MPHTSQLPFIIAHRGARNEFPENTLPAIRASLSIEGVQGTEFDVELTKDNKAVVLHQETVVPNQDFTEIEFASRDFISRDWVGQHTADEIYKLDTSRCSERNLGFVGVPSLAAVLALPWGLQTAFVELKDATFWGERNRERPSLIVAAVVPELLKFSGALNIISFNPFVLSELRKQASHIPTTLALWTEWQSRQQEAFKLAKTCGASALTIADTMVLDQSNWVIEGHSEGLEIFTYPISPARGEANYSDWSAKLQHQNWDRFLELGVDRMTSDFPRESVDFLKGRHQIDFSNR